MEEQQTSDRVEWQRRDGERATGTKGITPLVEGRRILRRGTNSKKCSMDMETFFLLKRYRHENNRKITTELNCMENRIHVFNKAC